MFSSSWWKDHTYLCGLQITPSHLKQYRTENGKFQKSVSTFRHGTVFAPK